MELIEQIKQNVSNRVSNNFDKVADILNSPYNWSLLDSLRLEVAYCILVDSTQDAVTLTNHLLEKTLKAVFMHGEPSTQNYTNAGSIQQHFAQLNKKYANMNLSTTINECFNKGLINEEQKNTLHKFRKDFRNAFGHANPVQIFGDKKKTVGIFNPFVHTKVKFSEVKVANFPFLQNTTQKQICDKEGIEYFRRVDSLIREILPKIFNMK